MVWRDFESAAFRAAMAASLHSKLGLGHRRVDAGNQHRRLPAEDEKLALNAGDAEDRSGNAPDPGQVQEIFDDGSAQERHAGRNAGAAAAARYQSFRIAR